MKTRQIILTATFSFCSYFLFAQEGTPPAQESKANTEVYNEHALDKKPEFPGGEQAMLKFLAEHIYYPPLARENAIQGMVVVSFIVEPDGKTSSTTIKRDIGGGCGKSAVKAISEMPKWSPGMLNGEAVRSSVVLPVRFYLGGGASSPGITPAQFGENQTDLESYIQTNIKYPKKAIKKKKEGVVRIRLYIDSEGKPRSVQLDKGFYPPCDKAALNLVKNMPNWKPQKDSSGTPQKSQTVVLEIPFKLPN
ncbi:MAG: TonB family protein [Saprospiraceae bacterium]